MPDENFYSDNPDLMFQMEQMVDWEPILKLRGQVDGENAMFESVEEGREANCEMLREPIGDIAATRIAPRAEDVDRTGCKLVDGTVIFPEGLVRNLEDLKNADLCGITIEPEYGGLGFSKTFYTAATEIISRADASLMNFFGLQGIAETIQQFGGDDLKDKYLPDMAAGKKTGAMVLTEPDAGSDLAAVRARGDLEANVDPETGEWKLRGTKRFITNGCGDVHVVLARSEDPTKRAGARGLSMFVVEKTERLHVRRIEDKLGIHGSPTCELYYDDCPARLLGKRGAGLARYTAWLMAAARLGVAAQGLGICEAARREGEKYATEREQFGKPIREFPQVAAMLADMRMYTEAARALLYSTSFAVDMQEAYEKLGDRPSERQWASVADLLTPLAKYYCTELANEVSTLNIQVHGGNGFMRDYPGERLFRDARITNIYEGTSQIQVNWAILRIVKGDLAPVLERVSTGSFSDDELVARVRQAQSLLEEAVAHIKDMGGDYRDLMAKRICDMTIDVYVSWLFLQQAEKWDYKKKVAKRFITDMLPRVRLNHEHVLSNRPLDLDLLGE